jgi:hypothetical protein
MIDTTSIANELSRHVAVTVERKLVECIERHIGRVPSNEEVARYGRCFIGPEWTHYRWDGEPLFSYRVRLNGFKYVVDVIQPVEELS